MDNTIGPDRNRLYVGNPTFVEGQAVGTLCCHFGQPQMGVTEAQKLYIEEQALRIGKTLEALGPTAAWLDAHASQDTSLHQVHQ